MIVNEEEQAKEKNAPQQKEKDVAGLLEHIQKTLNEHIKQVRLSDSSGGAPARLVDTKVDYSLQLARPLQKDNEGNQKQRRILELNPEHPIFFKLFRRFEMNEHDAVLGACAELLLGYALIAEGAALSDPSRFNRLLAGCILHTL
jgi:molecular chaperone HtpG